MVKSVMSYYMDDFDSKELDVFGLNEILECRVYSGTDPQTST